MQQDEDIRIIDLPETATVSPGMMVAVDSEAAGSKSFDLGTMSQNIDTVEGQVAAIRQVPESSSGNEGQVLTVDSEGTPGWADVPKELPATLGTVGQVLTVDQNGPAWNDIPRELPSTLGTAGQVLTVGTTGVEWANAPTELPATLGTAGQVLTVGSSGVEWANAPQELPSTLGTIGQVLSVGNSGVEWANVSSVSDLALVTGSTGAEKAANCQSIIDAGKIPVYNMTISVNGEKYNRVLVYQYSDSSSFYFMGLYPQYFMSGSSVSFRTDTANVYLLMAHFSKSDFGNGFTERTIDDLMNGSVVTSDSASITVRNNRHTVVSSTYTDGKSTLTVKIHDEGLITNAAFELSPNTNMTLTVERIGGSTLKHSVAAGNQLEAGKYYQVTAVGNCWTLAEFTA